MKHPWKKNFFKVPSEILSKLDNINSECVIVGSIKEIPIQDIINGTYNHLNITVRDSNIQFPSQIIPNINSGRYSKYNLFGRVIPLKHLPKVDKDFTVEAPIYGDSSKGYTEVTWTKKVWQKQIILPRELSINISLLQKGEASYIFKFFIELPLFKNAKNFFEDLLFYCNLIQENTGACNIFEEDAANQQYINTLYVNWELLPEGVKDSEFFDIILKKIKTTSPETIEDLKERLEFFNTLEVKHKILGTNNFNRYFGAVLKNDFAIFENIKYGNAIYIFKKNWHELSRMSKIELQQIETKDIIRIPHSKNWKKNVTRSIDEVS
ncbi:hypothetical protein KQI86_16655 [Clostridium sp. MSJ-11]|uniref:Uncharacterized protein n=1 Tax=Clostridium mobile TaxID=2841512 RepID=A0ABS6ELQ1_9CLOT|nr:hypothetical protein [Clostridium mobile]MBU5485953.1 hypothetical protein [Clostridium mobile]